MEFHKTKSTKQTQSNLKAVANARNSESTEVSGQMQRTDSSILIDPFSLEDGFERADLRDSLEIVREVGGSESDSLARDAYLIFRAFCKLAIKVAYACNA